MKRWDLWFHHKDTEISLKKNICQKWMESSVICSIRTGFRKKRQSFMFTLLKYYSVTCGKCKLYYIKHCQTMLLLIFSWWEKPNCFITIWAFVLKTIDVMGCTLWTSSSCQISAGWKMNWATKRCKSRDMYCDTHFVLRYDIYFLCIAIYRVIAYCDTTTLKLDLCDKNNLQIN